jgi:hypothetical protein
MTGQAYTRSLGCGARSSGLVRVLGGLVFLPARSVSPGEARARNVMSWLEAWKRVEQATTRHTRTAGCQATITTAYLTWHSWMGFLEVMAGCLLGGAIAAASVRHAVVTHAVEAALDMATSVG